MRHRRLGRKLGRNPNHQRALLRALASALFLTERDAEGEGNAPKTPGRIITTLPKAKEVRPLVERCITIAVRALPHIEEAARLDEGGERGSDARRTWRKSDLGQQWHQTAAKGVAARRRVLRLLGSREAMMVLFETVAPRYVDRSGGYTRILKLAKPRLGDAGARAILQLVGRDDRPKRTRPARPAFETQAEPTVSDAPAPAEQPAQ